MLFFNKTKIIVYAFIQKQNSEFLVVRRANHDSHPGLWEMPGGGLEFGEEPMEGIIREVKEETGLDINLIKIISYKSQVEGKFRKQQSLRLCFWAKLQNEEQQIILSEDHSNYCWIKKPFNNNMSHFLLKTLAELRII